MRWTDCLKRVASVTFLKKANTATPASLVGTEMSLDPHTSQAEGEHQGRYEDIQAADHSRGHQEAIDQGKMREHGKTCERRGSEIVLFQQV